MENRKNNEDEELEAFNRDAFYDLQFDWYAYDSFGNIAQFIAGTLPIPKRVFKNKDEYYEMVNYFRSLPAITNSRLTDRFAVKHRNVLLAVLFGGGNYDTFLKTSKKGLYSVYEIYEGEVEVYNNHYTEGCYYMVATPQEALNINSLPENIKELIKPYYLQINFADIDKINITELIEYEI